MSNYETIAGKNPLIDSCCPPCAEFAPAASGGDDLGRCDHHATCAPQPTNQVNVFQNGHVRESAQTVERIGSEEDRLVTVGRLQEPGTKVRHPGDRQSKGPRRNSMLGNYLANVPIEVFRQPGIGVEEELDLAGGCCRSCVHLPSAASWSRQRPGAAGLGNLPDRLATVLVDDDCLHVAPAPG